MTSINPKIGCNCYWEMPFRKNCRITYENLYHKENHFFYQIDYLVGEVPENAGYFHAQFRRVNPVKRKEVYTIVDGIEGRGQYVGTYMYWMPHSNDWWGEGEIKFSMDGDKDYPTICGTGAEDCFCGNDGYLADYAGHYVGFIKAKPDFSSSYQPGFAMYRWHVSDPICFEKDLRVTIQDLGWASTDRSQGYAALTDDISSVAYWYQMEPAKKMHPLPPVEELVIL